jgi:hypothetical protein
MPGGKLDTTVEEIRAKSMASALDWLRTKNVSFADLDDVSVASFMTLGAMKMGSAQDKTKTKRWPASGKIAEVTSIPCLRCQKCSSGPMLYQKLTFGQNRWQALWTGSGTITLTMSRPSTRQLHLKVSLVLAT